MKRWIALLLLVTLFLTGCEKKSAEAKSEWQRECALWSGLYYATEFEKMALPDSDLQIAYDGEQYTLFDENGQRNYRYLISCPEQDKTGYTERLILSDDPGMRAEKITGPEDGVLLMEKKISFLLTPNYGKIPEVVSVLSTAEERAYGIIYGKDTFYALLRENGKNSVIRLDYAGNELCRIEGREGYLTIWELENDDFLLGVEDYTNRYYAVECYSADGAHRWTYQFREGELTNAHDVVQHDGKLYYFGTVHGEESNSTDLLACVLSGDGLLLDEATFGSSDFDSADYIEKTDNGFVLYGTTHGSDGDFPFSPDGYGREFRAKLSFDLELLRAQESELDDYGSVSQIGFLNREPIYVDSYGDFVPMPELPEHILSAEGVFSYADGYVVRHTRHLETVALLNSPPWRSYSPRYRERIYTGYSTEGKLLWRYADIVIR